MARPHILKRILIERLTEPLHLNLLSLGAAFGSYRSKIAFDLVVRQQHAHGLLRAADDARARGLGRVTVVEMGVGSGAGLLNIVDIAGRLTAETGIAFDIYGFDTGRGLPPPRDHRDHPELYLEADYPMDRAAIEAALPPHAHLIIGDLAVTLPPFIAAARPQSPLGFATLDVDYYWSSKAALMLFEGAATNYLPQVSLYVDDIALDSHNEWCGELLAIDEFNATHPLRKIGWDRFLRHQRVFKSAEWLEHMYKVHVLDHPSRSTPAVRVDPQPMLNPYL